MYTENDEQNRLAKYIKELKKTQNQKIILTSEK